MYEIITLQCFLSAQFKAIGMGNSVNVMMNLGPHCFKFIIINGK